MPTQESFRHRGINLKSFGKGNILKSLRLYSVLFFIFALGLFFLFETHKAKPIGVGNFSKKLLAELKVQKKIFVEDVFIDGEEDIFVLFRKKSGTWLNVFDKNGNVKTLKQLGINSKFDYFLKVDRDENILVCGKGLHFDFGSVMQEQIRLKEVPAYIFDRNLNKIDVFNAPAYVGLEFSDGIVYRVGDGRVEYKLPLSIGGLKRYVFLNRIFECFNYGYLPKKIDDFVYRGQGQMGEDGTIYLLFGREYKRPSVIFWKVYKAPSVTTMLFKFSPDLQLIGEIPTDKMPFLNPETNRLYEVDISVNDGEIKVYSWTPDRNLSNEK